MIYITSTDYANTSLIIDGLVLALASAEIDLLIACKPKRNYNPLLTQKPQYARDYCKMVIQQIGEIVNDEERADIKQRAARQVKWSYECYKNNYYSYII